MKKILIGITGFLMAIADTMPGLSGGTIAFIMGYYDEFIESIKNLTNKEKRKKSIKFLINLGVGWIGGALIGILLIDKLLSENPYEMISFFMGLVIIAIPYTFKGELINMKNRKNMIFTIIGAALVVGISSSGKLISLDFQNGIPIYMYLYLFIVAMVAISGMLLPGISGSTILLIFGVYTFIIGYIKDFILTLDFGLLPVIMVVVLGIVVGALSVARAISYAFKQHRGRMLYLILGLMIGSLYSIWNAAPLIEKVAEKGIMHNAMGIENFNIISFICGICVIIGIEYIKKLFNNKKDENEI